MKKNDKVTIEITAMSSEGMGIGRHENIAVFVQSAAIGDVVDVIIIKVLKKYCIGKIINFVKTSCDRVTSDCDVFGSCGGCAYRHINYKAECKIKHQRVEDAIRRIGGINAPVLEIIPAKNTIGYRNKAQYPVGYDSNKQLITGFYALHSHRIVNNTNCALQPVEFEDILKVCIEFLKDKNIDAYDEIENKGLVRHIYIRKAEATGEILVCVVINTDDIPHKNELVQLLLQANKNIVGVVLNINKQRTNVILGNKTRVLWGRDYIIDQLCGVKFRISPLSFYQVNSIMAQRLYTIAAEYAQPDGKTVLDLYCGAGTIGLIIAKAAKRIIGVESVPQAVQDANFNAKLNDINNVEFICDTASNAAAELEKKEIKPDVVIIDPPRKGVDKALIETIARGFAPERVVYVSCDPGTLARDLKEFELLGYKTNKIQPVDLFPRTSHVETVVLITRAKE